MQKFGFIYLWFDKKHYRFYLGRHWGTEDDGYICSSKTMREAYRRRPSDFKRRIISKIYDKESLVVEEQKWLNMINPCELLVKYYNKTKRATTPSTKGYNHSKETRDKISKANMGRKVSEETKEKMRLSSIKQFQNIESRRMLSEKSIKMWNDPEYRKVNTDNKRGVKQSKETVDKRQLTKELTGRKGGPSKGSIPWNKGKRKIYNE